MTWMYFAEKVKEKTKGRLEIQVYHSGQLGQTKDLYLGMQMGNVEMAKLPVSFTGEWIPEVYVFDLPYLFNDREEMWRVFNSSVGKKFFNEIYPKQNLVGIMWADDGGRSIYTVNKAVRKPEDLKGLKIRVQPSAIHIQSINEMGGIATPTAWGEVYLALQQKVLDGAENSPVLFWTSKHWEVCKVYSMTQQFWLPTPLMASKKWWDSLPKDIQGQVAEARSRSREILSQRICRPLKIMPWVGRRRKGFRSLPMWISLPSRNGSSPSMIRLSKSMHSAKTSWTRSGGKEEVRKDSVQEPPDPALSPVAGETAGLMQNSHRNS